MSGRATKIDVAVVGVGRMGRHHVRTYSKLPQANLLAVVDRDEERAATIADEYGCRFYTSLDELLEQHQELRAVSVAVPTVAHMEVARAMLTRGVACLVEKPMAPTVAEAREMAQLAIDHEAILQVGHTERFNPAVRAVAAMDIPARFMEIHRVSPMTFRSLDVGVVMDMMIHDLDIVLALARSHLVNVEATGVPIFGEHEDIANARLIFGNGCVANLTASRLALNTQRRLRLFSETAYVSLDYQKRTGIVLRRSDNAEALERVRRELSTGADLSDLDYSELVHADELHMDLPEGEEDPLTAELTTFLASVRDGAAPVVDGAAGYAAVEAAERVEHAMRAHRWEGLGPARVR